MENPPRPPGRLLDKVKFRLRTKHYSYRTEQAYLHWLTEVKKLRSFLEELCGEKITNQSLRKSIRLLNAERRFRQEVYSYGSYDPPYIKGTEASLLSGRIAGMTSEEPAYQKLLASLEGRRRNGQAVAAAQARTY